MARHDREDPHSLEEQLAWLDAIKENEEAAPAPVTVTVEESVASSPYPKDPWSHVPAEVAPASSPLFRAAGDPAHGAARPEEPAERSQADTTEIRPSVLNALDRWAPATSPGPAPAASGHVAVSPPSPPSPPPPASSAPPAASAAPAETSTGDDTDHFSFGSLADPPKTGASGWLSLPPVTGGDKTVPQPEPEPDPEPVRGWLEAALPATEPGEPDPEQERFNAFAAGTGVAGGGADTEDIVVSRVEHPLYERAAEPVTGPVSGPVTGPQQPPQAAPTPRPEPVQARTSPPAETAPPRITPPAETNPPHISPPAETAPPRAAPVTEAPQPAAEPAPARTAAASSPAAEPAAEEKPAEEREPYRPRRRQTQNPDEFKPAFAAPARQPRGAKGAAAAATGARPTADSLDPVSLLRGRRNSPASGWRKVVYKASAGLIKPGESPEVRRRRELVTRARTPVVTGHHRVAVLSLKGGVGKTTTTVGLGATLASIRGDRVIAVDANPDRGTLSDKVELETSATVRDLLNERQQIKRYVDIRAFTSQAPSRLEILASDRDPSVSEAFSSGDYQAVAQVLENFYSICITDCGTGLLHSAMSGVLGLADQLVLVSSPSVDGARAASATLDWLEAHHYAGLVKAATVVLCSVRPRSKSTVDLDKLESHFAARCRAVVRVPYDPHLEEGAEIDLDRLQPATRQAYLSLAASVGDGFGGAHG
ncbi:hypothetical protein Skr01_35530 [Sphaerisporangium krabiense]|uniref:MinD-like ATPase involved in chromosome partitioning or flagellar assembly n=1 Tax=Sphaerisporangium krabiense TaxID=763782 RepID=A0A7W8Z3V1_9ACTN|nr:MinD/ParA family protein [Sphaerisporangium krabiense]MBB5626548.1 MinD-like ATPase involved in chromosome partitioning or flagellar assembly [Sphaerisporangium krabiense]GII63468.1 hypothetical protein Skr01_35530 [Sphaerisporangium krabiense]